MKRPFAYLGFSCLFGLLVVFFTNIVVGLVLVACLLVLFIFLIVKKIKYTEMKLCIVGIALSILSFLIFADNTQYEKYDGNTYTIEAILLDVFDYGDYGTTYKATVFSVDGEEVSPFTITLYSSIDILYEYGDAIYGDVQFTYLGNESGLSYYHSLLADGINMTAKLSSYDGYTVVQNEDDNFLISVLKFKKNLRKTININFNESTADLLVAMLLGDKTYLDDEVYNAFKASGVSHILVVSGMHLSILCAAFYLILGFINIPKKFIYLIVLPFIFIYIFLTGMGLSVIRSACMVLVLIFADITGEENDRLNSLGLAVLLISFINPYSAVDLGFLLSVSSTAGILVLTERLVFATIKNLPKRLRKYLQPIFSTFAVAISAFVFSGLIVLYSYGTINPLSILCSPILVLPATIFIIMGLSSLVFYSVSFLTPLAVLPSLVTILCGKFMLFVCEKFAIIGNDFWTFTGGIKIVLFIGLALILAIFLLFKAEKRVKIVALTASFVLIFTAYSVSLYDYHDIKMIVADTNYGNFVAIIQADTASVIYVDGYSSSTVDYIFDAYSVENVNYLFVIDETSSIVSHIEDEYYVENNISTNEIATSLEIFDEVFVSVRFDGKLIYVDIGDYSVAIDNVDLISSVITSDIIITESSDFNVNASLIIANLSEDTYIYNQNVLRLEDETFVIEFNDEIRIKRLE